MSNTVHYYHMLHSKSTCIFKKIFLDEFKRGEMVANSLLANINTMEVITAQKIKFSITLRSRIDVLPRLIFLEEKPRPPPPPALIRTPPFISFIYFLLRTFLGALSVLWSIQEVIQKKPVGWDFLNKKGERKKTQMVKVAKSRH